MKEEDLKIGMVLADWGIDQNLKILKIEDGIVYYNYYHNGPVYHNTIKDFLQESLTDDSKYLNDFKYSDEHY
jgi:hypothetical protein